ncbi:HNH endonuclease [Rhodococcus aetherivorans]
MRNRVRRPGAVRSNRSGCGWLTIPCGRRRRTLRHSGRRSSSPRRVGTGSGRSVHPTGTGGSTSSGRTGNAAILAHRFSVELVHGALDPNVVCEHKCNDPLCVRVGHDHLIESTHSENVRYAIALGRLSGYALLDGHGASRLCDRRERGV